LCHAAPLAAFLVILTWKLRKLGYQKCPDFARTKKLGKPWPERAKEQPSFLPTIFRRPPSGRRIPTRRALSHPRRDKNPPQGYKRKRGIDLRSPPGVRRTYWPAAPSALIKSKIGSRRGGVNQIRRLLQPGPDPRRSEFRARGTLRRCPIPPWPRQPLK